MPSKKKIKQSNESVKSPKGKGVGLNCSPHLVVSPFSSSSSSSSSSPMPIKQRSKGSKGSSPRRPGPSSPGTDTPSLKVYDPTSDLKFAWGDFQKLNKSDLKSTAPPKVRNLSSGVVCCLRYGMWFKSKHGKGSCDANRPKDLGEYSFAVPQQLRETLAPSVAPEAAAAMAHSLQMNIL